MCEDLFFLSNYPEIQSWLGFSTQLNPFLVPPEILLEVCLLSLFSVLPLFTLSFSLLRESNLLQILFLCLVQNPRELIHSNLRPTPPPIRCLSILILIINPHSLSINKVFFITQRVKSKRNLI
jgi:hypothetical protein